MRRVFLFVLVAGMFGAIVYLILRWATPDLAKQIAFYAVGLGAFVVGTFKKILSFFGLDRGLDKAEARNEEIKSELERIKADLAQANERFEAEREAHRREIERLERRLADQREEVNATSAERERLREMDLDGYFESLPPEERRRIQAEMMEGVIDGSTLQ